MRWRALIAVAGLSTTLTAGAAGATPAAGSPLDDARAKAAVLAQQVHSLEDQVEVASESYAAVTAQLGAAVNRHLDAERELDDARLQLQQSRAAAGNRVRALWQDGGEAGLLLSLFAAKDLQDLANRTVFMKRIVGSDSADITDAQVATARAQQLDTELKANARQQTKLERQAEDTAARVRSMLAEKQALLDSAGAEIRRLADEERKRAEAAAAAAFRAALLAAGQQVGAGTAGLPAATSPSHVQAKVIAAARTLLGKPYVWGGTGPGGYDCSGLTGFAYAAAGISLPRTAAQQWLSGPHPQVQDMQPGDLLFWASDPTDMSSIHHVAIYLGNGMMISTNHTGDVARIQPVWLDEFVGATRPDPATALRVPGPRWAPGT